MIWYYLFALFGVVVSWWVCYWIGNRHIWAFYRQFPQPPTLPFIGNLWQLKSPKEFLGIVHNFVRLYGKTYTLQLGPTFQVLIVTDYKLVQFLLSSNQTIQKSSIGYEYIKPWIGDGLLTSSGQKWKAHRKLLTPAFHYKILERHVDVFDACASILIGKLKRNEGTFFNIHPFISMCSLDIICESAMNTKVHAQENDQSSYTQNVIRMCNIVVQRSLSLIKRLDLLYVFTKCYYDQCSTVKILHNHTNDVIRDRLEDRRLEVAKPVVNEGKHRLSFLDILLESDSISMEEIREEVDTFMFEGHDTTASAISFALYNLSIHKSVQDKVYAEQIAIFGDSSSNIQLTLSDLHKMTYLDMVIRETLRMYPSVPLIGRSITEPVELSDGLRIPAGVQIILFLFSILRDPDVFPDPDTFRPERFEHGREMPFSYVPFSAGPRNCIGQRFAMLEMKAIISKVIRNVELVPCVPKHELQVVGEIVLKSANGIMLGVKAR